MHRRQLILGGAALALGTGPALSAPVTARDLSLDLEIVRQAVSIHPGARRYLDESQLRAAQAGFEAAYQSAESLDGRFIALSQFLARLRCGHTQVNFYNQSRAVEADLLDRRTRLPFLFVWMDGAMIVTADHSGSRRLDPGTEILTVNGHPAGRILAEMMPYMRADGSNDGKRRDLLSVPGGEYHPTFDVFQSVFFPPLEGSFALTFRRPNGMTETVRVAAVDLNARRAMTPPPPPDDQPLWDWSVRPDGVVVLTMPTWVVYRGSWDWRGWLIERLDGLGDASGLIIDIRGCEGGLSCGDPILARLSNQDLILDDYEPRVRFRRSPPEMDAYFEAYDPESRTLGMQGVDVGDGFIGYPPARPADRIAAAGPRIPVRTAVLMDAANSSATFFFTARLKRLGLARLFGETSGGNLKGINAGQIFFVRLPGSGLEFDLPLVGNFPTSLQPDEGVAPDVRITCSAQDIAAGRDPVLSAAVDWIQRA
ncbi:MAG: peptidase S41 [Alphaproteobacteria bacterium]|nr:peptidase S41 [Alphaproteobacteria bacterium]MBU2377873.1 peptidase S41 [Alphaproteobacteria bacterium]